MAFRRRMRGGFRRKGTREQLIWVRQKLVTSDAAAFGTALVLTIFDPATILGGSALDQRFTIRRVKLRSIHRWNFTAGTGQTLRFYGGIYVGARGESRDPSLASAADQEGDWMALAQGGLSYAGGAINVQGPVGQISNPLSGFDPAQFDVRAMRKINSDEVMFYTTNLTANATDGKPTENAHIMEVLVSVLIQRTRR